MDWLRLYSEARTDRKLAVLTLGERGVWVNLLCYANEQQQRGTFDVSDRYLLALECAEGDEELLGTTLEKLQRVKHVVPCEDRDGWLIFRTFRTRQYEKPSDVPEQTRERKRLQRERARAEVTERDTDELRVTPRDMAGPSVMSRHTEADADTDTDPTDGVIADAAAGGVGDSRPTDDGGVGGGKTNTDAQSLAVLCAQVTQEAGLTGHNPTHLARCLARYHARASPEDVLAEACKAAEWIRAHPRRKMTVGFLDNWLKREFPISAVTSNQQGSRHDAVSRPTASDGGRAPGSSGTFSRGASPPTAHGIEQPDYTQDGIYVDVVQH